MALNVCLFSGLETRLKIVIKIRPADLQYGQTGVWYSCRPKMTVTPTTTNSQETKMSESYKTITVKDLVNFVSNDKKNFPQGLDTPITSGDFEGNFHHVLHELFIDKLGEKEAVFIGYEMHETDGC